jgi:hypothetical protein
MKEMTLSRNILVVRSSTPVKIRLASSSDLIVTGAREGLDEPQDARPHPNDPPDAQPAVDATPIAGVL